MLGAIRDTFAVDPYWKHPSPTAPYTASMSTDLPFQPRPADFKTSMDGTGGLVRVTLTGGLHEGRELFIDEPDVPTEIYTTPRREPFEWWPARLREAMARTALGGDPDAPPTRYVLRLAEDTREPRFVAEPIAG